METPSPVIPADDDLLLSDPWRDYASAQSRRAAALAPLEWCHENDSAPAQPWPVAIHHHA
jgi:hypothetical protein